MKERLFLLAVVCFFTALTTAAQVKPVSVIESEIKVRYQKNNLSVSIPYQNGNDKESHGQLYLSLTAPDGTTFTTATKSARVVSGTGTFEASISVAGRNDLEDLMWYRLEYRLGVKGETATGIVSLSRVMSGFFRLDAVAVENVFPGIKFPVRIRATESFTGKPVGGVSITALLHHDDDEDDDDDKPTNSKKRFSLKAKTTSDADGFAEVFFDVPADAELREDELELELRGEKGGLMTVVYEDFDLQESDLSTFFLLDKPIYQPGQKVQFRALLMRSSPADSGFVVAQNKELTFVIKNEDGLAIYKSTVKSSKFGIVSGEWTIPPDAKLGTYRLETDNEDHSDDANTRFKVSRYELPNFVVQTEPDKSFYLPDQKIAEVTVTAQYLFGKPVAAGKVRVVREESRSWNFAEQKWDINEKEAFEGDADADGKFVAKIPLDEFHKSLSENEDDRFKDVTFTAYFTDATSNRTEEARFDLRVSKSPIHVYVSSLRDEIDSRLPFAAVVRTVAADGEPCACSFELRGRATEPKNLQFIPIAKGKADKFGNAIVEFQIPKEIATREGRLELQGSASDAENRRGTATREFSIDRNNDDVLVRADKAIYAPNEPINLRIDATVPSAEIFIDVTRNGSSVARQRVRLAGGRATVVVPYDASFQGALVVTALLGVGSEGDSAARSRTEVVYPRPRDLKLTAKTERETYRPGDDASMNFSVTGRNAKDAALGVVVLDRAVEERAATDTKFGSPPQILDDFWQFSGSSLTDVAPSKRTPEMQRSARIALDRYLNEIYENFDTSNGRNLGYKFREYSAKQFNGAEKFLREYFNRTLQYPKDAGTLSAVLREMKIDFPALRDPWGKPYRVRTRLDRDNEVLEVVSDGADKRQDTAGASDGDDYVAFSQSFPWFGATEKQVELAVREFIAANGKFVRDRETLRAALAVRAIDVDNLRDPWGTPIRAVFGVYQDNLTIDFSSAGEDKVFYEAGRSYDDARLTTVRTPYFTKEEARINEILQTTVVAKKTFPRTESDFKELLKSADFDFDALRDPYGRPFYLTYREFDRFADRVTIESVVAADGTARDTYVITPVTQKLGIFDIRSLGENGVRNQDSWLDWSVATITGVISEQTKDDAKPRAVVPKAALMNGQSALYVVVKDANNAIVAKAKVKLTRRTDGATVDEKETDEDGGVVFDRLAPGSYDVRVDSVGFKSLITQDVRLTASQIAQVVAKLEVGSVSEVVTVSSGVSMTVDSTDTKIDSVITRQVIDTLPRGTNFTALLRTAPYVNPEPSAGGFQLDGASGSETVFELNGRRESKTFESVRTDNQSTPRVRNYFPETLLWIPEVVTDKNGKLSIKFRTGDNITTWNVYAVASDEKGSVGLAKTEFKTFQPFFVDLDASKFLTVGDEIYLPSQVRNYTDTKQRVSVSMTREDWFELLTEPLQNIEVAPNSTTNAIFGFRAANAVAEGKQRVSAVAQKDADAIEKPITVRPDGEEIVRSESFLAHSNDATTVEFPSNAISGTQKSVLTIYPNTIAQVADAIDGLLRRPYGCAEQTISSTYPNLMLLKLARASEGVVNANAELKAKAAKNLKKGYERLIGYQRTDGGFGYWGPNSDADIALTAYAIRFLIDATGDIEVDRDIVTKARDSLVRAQNADGGFYVKYSWETSIDTRRALMNTAYVARILGKLAAAKASSKESDAALVKALDFVKNNRIRIDEPYTLALYGLAAADAGMTDEVTATAAKLNSMAIREESRVYWNLETNTPFYGWGTAGRVETTALVIQLLTKANEQRTTNNELISKAAMFLLKNKDRYGVWYSTQTTINVLDGFLAAFGTSSEGTIRVSANDREIAAIDVNAGSIAPIRVDLPTEGQVTVKIDSGGRDRTILAQIVQTHYIPWDISALTNVNVNQSRAVRLEYNCDKLNPKVTETVRCHVEAERIGFRGYGMLLAEIGVPPGAEVSRESLDEIKGISKYELLPDRIVFYMWATPGGTKFDFTFKPRYAINAKTPASFVYDYYNEEAKATVAPIKFEVK